MRTEAWVCAGLGVVLIAATGTVDGAAPGDLFSARSWPFAIGVLLVAINLPEVLRKTRPASGGEGYSEIRWMAFLRAVLPILALPLLIDAMGFLLGSIATTVWFMMSVGYPRRIAAVVSVCFSVVTVYFFTKIAYMPLPRGWGPFDDLSIFILRAMGAY